MAKYRRRIVVATLVVCLAALLGSRILRSQTQPTVDIVIPNGQTYVCTVDSSSPGVTAVGGPPGGTYTWSAAGATFSPQGSTGGHSNMSVTVPAAYSVTVEYKKDGLTAQDTEGTMVAIEADLKMANLADADELDPGGFLGVGGPRRCIDLFNAPEEPLGDKALTFEVSNKLAVYSLPTGGEPVEDFGWANFEPLDNWQTRQTRFWLAATEAGDASVQLTYFAEGQANSNEHVDLININCVSVDLDISGVSDTDEENPGGFVAVGGPRKAISLSVLPTDVGPVTLEVTEGIGKVAIYAAGTGGQPLGTPEWDTGADVPNTLFVEGLQVSGAREVEVALYCDETYACDTVNFSVLKLDLDSTATDESEDDPGVYIAKGAPAGGSPLDFRFWGALENLPVGLISIDVSDALSLCTDSACASELSPLEYSLADTEEREAFFDDVYNETLYVKGKTASAQPASNYVSLNLTDGQMAVGDTVVYTVIAVSLDGDTIEAEVGDTVPLSASALPDPADLPAAVDAALTWSVDGGGLAGSFVPNETDSSTTVFTATAAGEGAIEVEYAITNTPDTPEVSATRPIIVTSP
jgi:hypothetical protein